MRVSLVLFLCFWAFSCNQKPQPVAKEEAYFNIEQLLADEIRHLLSVKAGLEKKVTSDGNTDHITIVPADEDEWKGQLGLFLAANIAMPGNRGAYFSETLSLLEGHEKVIYTAKSAKQAVQTMECLYVDGELEQVDIVTGEHNVIFDSSKQLTLYLDKNSGHLRGFEIKGHEEMHLKDVLDFEVEAVITY